MWNLYRGSGLYLYIWDGTESAPREIELSAASGVFCHVVPVGTWQAAEPINGEVLAGCSVAPGFEYEDFELIEPDSDPARKIQTDAPHLTKFII